MEAEGTLVRGAVGERCTAADGQLLALTMRKPPVELVASMVRTFLCGWWTIGGFVATVMHASSALRIASLVVIHHRMAVYGRFPVMSDRHAFLLDEFGSWGSLIDKASAASHLRSGLGSRRLPGLRLSQRAVGWSPPMPQ